MKARPSEDSSIPCFSIIEFSTLYLRDVNNEARGKVSQSIRFFVRGVYY